MNDLTQEEQEYRDLLQEREAALQRIKQLQSDIAKLGLATGNQQQYNSLLQQRTRVLQQHATLEKQIRQAQGGPGQQALAFRSEVSRRMAEMAEARQRQLNEQRLAQAIRQQELQQRFGMGAGAFLAGAERFRGSAAGRAIGGAALAAGASIGGMARSGFSGTVEQNRFDYEFKLLSREVAAAFKPLLEVATTIVNRARRFMEGLSGTGQDAVMAGGLALGAYGSYRVGSAVLGTAGGLLGMGGGFAGRALASSGGVAARTAAAGGLGAGGAATGAGTAAAGAAASRGGLMARMGGAATAGLFGAIPVQAVNSYEMGSAAIRGLRAGDDRGRINAGTDILRMLRDGGGDVFGFGRLAYRFGGGDKALSDLEKQGFGTPAEKPKDRRSVTPADFGFEETGSAYQRAALSYLSTTAMEAEQKAAAPPTPPSSSPDAADPVATAVTDGIDKLFSLVQDGLSALLRPDVR